ncbi:unnamed protein product [Owenia fusiformis]|uniref:Uncharacterized protein n=1 Tax=Owenia fusiformis TaxID=6347 RepID=A0A8J1TGE5_OWEFU|nr:unnamed protein product [Owenia fusiformis]
MKLFKKLKVNSALHIKIFKDHMALKAELEDANNKAEQATDSRELSKALSVIPRMASQWELSSDQKYGDSIYDQQSYGSYYSDSSSMPTLDAASVTGNSQSSCSFSSSDLSRTLQSGSKNLDYKLRENVKTLKVTNASHNTVDISRRNTPTRAIYNDMNQTNMSGDVQCCVMPLKLRKSLKTTNNTNKLSNRPMKGGSEPELNKIHTLKDEFGQFRSEQNIHKMSSKIRSKLKKKRLGSIKESDNDIPNCCDLEKKFPSPRIPTLEQTIQHGCLPNIKRRKSCSQSRKSKMPIKSQTNTSKMVPPPFATLDTRGPKATKKVSQSSSSHSSTDYVLPRTSTKKHLTSDLPRTSTKVKLIYKTESDIEKNTDATPVRQKSEKSHLQTADTQSTSTPRSMLFKCCKCLSTTACELRRTYERRQSIGKTSTTHTCESSSSDSVSVWTIYELEVNDFNDVFKEPSNSVEIQRPLGSKDESNSNIRELSSISKYHNHNECADHAVHNTLEERGSIFQQKRPLSPTTSHISCKPDFSKRYFPSDSDLSSLNSDISPVSISSYTSSQCDVCSKQPCSHNAFPQHLGYAVRKIANSHQPIEDIDCSMNATCASIPDMGEVGTPSIYHDTQDYNHDTPDDLSGTWNSESDDSSMYESDTD